MIKTLLLGSLACCSAPFVLGFAGASASPDPSPEFRPLAAPTGLYLEARDATVWGGACHISSEAESGGSRALLGWAFADGGVGGVDLTGVRVVAAIEGTCNLQGAEVFGTDELPSIASELWVDAPNQAAFEAAVGLVSASVDLGANARVHEGDVVVRLSGVRFELIAGESTRLTGEAISDGSCCTMPESRWYTPLADVQGSVVGFSDECRFASEGSGLESWSFQGANSVFVASDFTVAVE